MITVSAGFLPLNDAAVLVAAREFGFAEDEGLDLRLVKETSWANIRDRMSVGHFEAAHMLAPMPIAANLGLAVPSPALIAPLALGLGGNAVTVSQSLWEKMAKNGAVENLDPKVNGAALAQTIRATPDSKLRLAVVHPHSGHNFDLRYWLSASGIDPDRHIDIVIVPPPLLPQALSLGRIDGYCVGEPWNSLAVHDGKGVIVTTKSAIWRSSPEKVLAVSANWGADNQDTVSKLIRALVRAAQWCNDAGNIPRLADTLAGETYVDAPAKLIQQGLTGRLAGAGSAIEDFFLMYDRAATFPWQSHALWFYSQMVRWKQLDHSPERARIASRSYRPDLYRKALEGTGIAVPGASAKVEGALQHGYPAGATKGHITLGPDGFFDGRVFDPESLEDYLKSQQ